MESEGSLAAVIGSRNWISPAPELEDVFSPQKEWIVNAIRENIMSLAGYIVKTNQSAGGVNSRYGFGI